MLYRDDGSWWIKRISDQLLLALENAILNKDKRKTATDLSYKRLCENFTWDTVESKVESIIEEFRKG